MSDTGGNGEMSEMPDYSILENMSCGVLLQHTSVIAAAVASRNLGGQNSVRRLLYA